MTEYRLFVQQNNLGRDVWLIQDRVTGEYVFQTKIRARAIDRLRELIKQVSQ